MSEGCLGKVVSAKNVIIAANKILEDYSRKTLKTNHKTLHKAHTPREASNPLVPKRLDRRDRTIVVQNACEVYSNMDPESFKETCRQVNISPVTFTYVRNVLRSDENVLNLRNHGIGPTGALTIVNELIVSSKCIVELDLSSNNLGDQGTEAVCQFLKKNYSVVHVNLSRNDLRKAAVDALAHMLTQNETLTHLVISHNAITEEDLELLASVLQTHQTLKTLDLSSNSFTPRSGALFGFLVAKNTSLVNFNLSCNHIGDDGVRDLATGLINNRTIRRLDLSWNDITNDGALWIAEVLTSNSVLQELNLSCNQIASKGVDFIAESLAVNVTLNVLEISGNSLVSEDAVSLLKCILKNSSMKLNRLYLGEVITSTDIHHLFQKLRDKYPKFMVWGIVGAAGQPVRITSKNNAMEALEDYFEKNKLNSNISFFE